MGLHIAIVENQWNEKIMVGQESALGTVANLVPMLHHTSGFSGDKLAMSLVLQCCKIPALRDLVLYPEIFAIEKMAKELLC